MFILSIEDKLELLILSQIFTELNHFAENSLHLGQNKGSISWVFSSENLRLNFQTVK